MAIELKIDAALHGIQIPDDAVGIKHEKVELSKEAKAAHDAALKEAQERIAKRTRGNG